MISALRFAGLVFVAAASFHKSPQDGVHAGLIPAPLLLEPVNNIGIEAHGQLLLGLFWWYPRFGLPEKIIAEFWNVGIINILVPDGFDFFKPSF